MKLDFMGTWFSCMDQINNQMSRCMSLVIFLNGDTNYFNKGPLVYGLFKSLGNRNRRCFLGEKAKKKLIAKESEPFVYSHAVSHWAQ